MQITRIMSAGAVQGGDAVKICPQKAVESQMHLIFSPLLL